MGYDRGDVILVVYRPPTAGPGRATRSRPMVIVSTEIYHVERPQDILAALVTTKTTKYRGKTDHLLREWQDAGLHEPSVVRATLATVERHHIGGKVGKLTPKDLQGVDAALRTAFGWATARRDPAHKI